MKGNVRKYASVLCIIFFFFASTSFTYINDEQISTDESGSDHFDFIAQLSEEQLNGFYANGTAQAGVLEEDGLEGYENAETDYDESDLASMDEILLDDDNEKYMGDAENTEGSVSDNDVGSSQKLSRNDWKLILINKHHSIPEGYEFPLGNINASMRCDERIIPDLLEMLKAARNDGVSLIICSPYRDLNRQEALFNRKIKAYMRQGMSYLEAYQISSQAVTVPGSSEHQLGLAIDFLTNNYSSLNEGFADTQAGKWLAEHGCEYGFILRYPKGKEYITGIEYEPWHYRYVGKEAATQIMQQNLTLEEFVDMLDE